MGSFDTEKWMGGLPEAEGRKEEEPNNRRCLYLDDTEHELPTLLLVLDGVGCRLFRVPGAAAEPHPSGRGSRRCGLWLLEPGTDDATCR